jgi:hypothetical protein
LTVRAQIIRNKVNDEEVEKMARALLNAPPKKKSRSRKKK